MNIIMLLFFLNLCVILSPCAPNPSCLQTTRASLVPQRSSHTVPHSLSIQTSTLPSVSFDPPTSLISPSVQLTKEIINSAFIHAAKYRLFTYILRQCK